MNETTPAAAKTSPSIVVVRYTTINAKMSFVRKEKTFKSEAAAEKFFAKEEEKGTLYSIDAYHYGN